VPTSFTVGFTIGSVTSVHLYGSVDVNGDGSLIYEGDSKDNPYSVSPGTVISGVAIEVVPN
jgi:hypothetical protein